MIITRVSHERSSIYCSMERVFWESIRFSARHRQCSTVYWQCRFITRCRNPIRLHGKTPDIAVRCHRSCHCVHYPGCFRALWDVCLFSCTCWSWFHVGRAATPMLITELAYPTHRGKYTSAFWTMYYLGAILASWASYGTQKHLNTSEWSWRVPSIIQAGLPIVQILLWWLVPESPR